MSEIDSLRAAIWEHAYSSDSAYGGWRCNYCGMMTGDRPPMPVEKHQPECVVAAEAMRRRTVTGITETISNEETINLLWHYIHGLHVGSRVSTEEDVQGKLFALADMWRMKRPVFEEGL